MNVLEGAEAEARDEQPDHVRAGDPVQLAVPDLAPHRAVVAAAQPAPQRYVICNGDEGDPGAFMDRNVIEGDPFAVLGVPKNATMDQVRKAYRELSARYHPDKVAFLKEIGVAWMRGSTISRAGM